MCKTTERCTELIICLWPEQKECHKQIAHLLTDYRRLSNSTITP